MLSPAGAHVKLAAGLVVELAHCRHPGLRFLGCNKGLRSRILLRREIAHLLRDLHRAEFGAAHRAEVGGLGAFRRQGRSEEHTSELQSLMRISYAVFCLKKKKKTRHNTTKVYRN